MKRVGIIETIRKNGDITVILNHHPQGETHYVINKKRQIGQIIFIRQIENSDSKLRFLAKIKIIKKEFTRVIRPGTEIAIEDKAIDKKLTKYSYKELVKYKPVIITNPDEREMLFVKDGKYYLGSSVGEKDIMPGKVENIKGFYMDKFEVSNLDFKKFADLKGYDYPQYWKNHLNQKEFSSIFFANLPVIVTYSEATDYAKWAGKRLPAEIEWEKAARGPINKNDKNVAVLYTWGTKFREGLANTKEFWLNESTGENLKKTLSLKYNIDKVSKGYIPVNVYENEACSYYGIAHMNGNAPEWTSSWYRAYDGSAYKNMRFGTQYKVIRGGSFYWGKDKASIIDRKIGGIPNLYKDRAAGFRCIKDVSKNDQI